LKNCEIAWNRNNSHSDYFQSKSHVTILFIGTGKRISQPACPPLNVARWACRDYFTKNLAVWPTSST